MTVGECTPQGMLLRDVESVLILRHMAFFATLILLVATAALEGDVLQRLPPAMAIRFYTLAFLNCSLAIASNLLNMLVTKANGALSLQVCNEPAECCNYLQSIMCPTTARITASMPAWPHSDGSFLCVTQVFGNLFGVLATVFSIALFRNPVSLAGLSGYSLTVFGVLLYMREKYGKGAAAPAPADKPSEGGANAA